MGYLASASLSKLVEHKKSMLCGHDTEFGAKMT